MSGTGILTPILIEIDQIKRRICNISFDKDGSIYLFFPRKLGYVVTVQTDIQLPIVGKRQITMSKGKFTKGTPYVSFHPKKMCLHVNTQVHGERYKTDVPILNQGLNAVVFPLSQLFIPTFSYFDIYKQKKTHGPPLNLSSNVSNPTVSLNVSIWIHPKDTIFNFDEMPLKHVYDKEFKVVGGMTFNHSTNNPYICTLLIAEAKQSEIKDGVKPEIIVSVFNDKQPYVFGLSPS